MRRLRLVAVACAAFALASGLGARAASLVPAPTATRDAGVTIVTQPDPAASLAGIVFLVRSGLDRQTLAQNGLAALTAEGILRTPVSSGVTLADAIAAQGGSISYQVDGRDARFYIEGLASNEASLLALFEGALSNPDFSPATLQAARAELDRKSDQNQRIALQVGLDMLDRQFFENANAGLPEFGDATSVAQFVGSDVRSFYARAYRRGGAVISAAGALDALPAGSLNRLAETLPSGSSNAIDVKMNALRGASRQLIAHRDVAAPWLVAQYPAPSLGSRDFGAMLVLSAFLDRTLADVADIPNLVSRTVADRAVGTLYNFEASPANLVVYVDGGLGNPNRTFATVLSVVNIIGATELQGSLDQFKSSAQGDYIAGTTTLGDRASIAATFAMQNASPDYLNRTLASIAAVTPADLRRVARTYLGNPMVALVLPREGS
jgi:predicted Zn-dependent peptidase